MTPADAPKVRRPATTMAAPMRPAVTGSSSQIRPARVRRPTPRGDPRNPAARATAVCRARFVMVGRRRA